MEHTPGDYFYTPTQVRQMAAKKDDRNSHIDMLLVGLAPLPPTRELGTRATASLKTRQKASVPGGHSELKRVVSSERNVGAEAGSTPSDFSQLIRAGVRAHNDVRTKQESLRKAFKKVYDLKFHEFVMVAIRKAIPREKSL